MNPVLTENGAIYYPSAKSEKDLVIYLHSLTQGPETEFAQAAIKNIVDRGHDVLTFKFEFLIEESAPSTGLLTEVKKLAEMVDSTKNNFSSKKILLVGKSLGGCIAMAYAAKNSASDINNITILGLPLELGFPPRTELLKGAKAEKFDPMNEYVEILKKIKTSVHIIQGGADDLGPIEKCQELISGGKVTLDVVEGADHSFFVNGEQRWDKCFNRLAEYLGK